MSYFGDHTPQQDLLESAENIACEWNLTSEQLLIILLKVASALVDPFDVKFDALP